MASESLGANRQGSLPPSVTQEHGHLGAERLIPDLYLEPPKFNPFPWNGDTAPLPQRV